MEGLLFAFLSLVGQHLVYITLGLLTMHKEHKWVSVIVGKYNPANKHWLKNPDTQTYYEVVQGCMSSLAKGICFRANLSNYVLET